MKKKWGAGLCLAVLIALNCRDVPAAGFDDSDLLRSEDYGKMLELDSELRSASYYTYNGEDSSLADREIAYDKAVRVYTNANIFNDKEITADEIRDILEKHTDYEWIVPVYYCGETAMVQLARTEDAFAFKSSTLLDHHGDYRKLVTDTIDYLELPLEETDVYFLQYEINAESSWRILIAVALCGGERYVISCETNPELLDAAAGEAVVPFDTMADRIHAKLEEEARMEQELKASEKEREAWWNERNAGTSLADFGGFSVRGVLFAGGAVLLVSGGAGIFFVRRKHRQKRICVLILCCGCAAVLAAGLSETKEPLTDYMIQNRASLLSALDWEQTEEVSECSIHSTYSGLLGVDLSETENVSNYAEAVVLGTVVGDSYVHVDISEEYSGIYEETPWTFTAVRVDDVIRGDLARGDLITLGEEKGFYTQQDYCYFFREKGYTEGGCDSVEEALASAVYTGDGAPELKIGDQLVLCLLRTETEDLDGTFWTPVGGRNGKYYRLAENAYWQVSYPGFPYAESYAEDLTRYTEALVSAADGYTYEELQTIFQ